MGRRKKRGRPRNRPPRGLVGAPLRELRLLRGWSLAELAERSGVSLPALARYETGARAPAGQQASALSQALEIGLGPRRWRAARPKPGGRVCGVVRGCPHRLVAWREGVEAKPVLLRPRPGGAPFWCWPEDPAGQRSFAEAIVKSERGERWPERYREGVLGALVEFHLSRCPRDEEWALRPRVVQRIVRWLEKRERAGLRLAPPWSDR